jgi:hypothetical protein
MASDFSLLNAVADMPTEVDRPLRESAIVKV